MRHGEFSHFVTIIDDPAMLTRAARAQPELVLDYRQQWHGRTVRVRHRLPGALSSCRIICPHDPWLHLFAEVRPAVCGERAVAATRFSRVSSGHGNASEPSARAVRALLQFVDSVDCNREPGPISLAAGPWACPSTAGTRERVHRAQRPELRELLGRRGEPGSSLADSDRR